MQIASCKLGISIITALGNDTGESDQLGVMYWANGFVTMVPDITLSLASLHRCR